MPGMFIILNSFFAGKAHIYTITIFFTVPVPNNILMWFYTLSLIMSDTWKLPQKIVDFGLSWWSAKLAGDWRSIFDNDVVNEYTFSLPFTINYYINSCYRLPITETFIVRHPSNCIFQQRWTALLHLL